VIAMDYTMDDLCILLHRVKCNTKRCKANPLGTKECSVKIAYAEIRQLFIEQEIRDRLRRLHA
jgi:hypothetical protein